MFASPHRSHKHYFCCVVGTWHINQELALYTDADVMFYHGLDPCQLGNPEVMAIGPEMDRDTTSWAATNKNSGVLLINCKGLLEVLPGMLAYSNSKEWDFEVTDQSLINEYFPHHDSGLRELDQLSNVYNWKGYWGCSPQVVLTHWHGPKPERCLPCYLQHRIEYKTQQEAYVKACGCPDVYNELWRRAMVTDRGRLYAKMMHDHMEYATSNAKTSGKSR